METLHAGTGMSAIPHLREFDENTFNELLVFTLYRLNLYGQAPPKSKLGGTGNDAHDFWSKWAESKLEAADRRECTPDSAEDAVDAARRQDVSGADRAYWCEMFHLRHVRVLDGTSRGHVDIPQLLHKVC